MTSTPPNQPVPYANGGVPIELLRAELKAAMSDQMLILIDRFAARRDLEDVKVLISGQRTETDKKIDTLVDFVKENTVSEERSRQIADDALDARLSRSWIVKSSRATVGLLGVAVVSLICSPIVAYLIAKSARAH